METIIHHESLAESSRFDEALAAACRGEASREDACVLIRAGNGGQTRRLLEAASDVRDRLKGRAITFSRKVFIPLTNLCRDRCAYCTFRKDPEEPGAFTMTPDDVIRVAEEGARLGCREALFSLGDRPEARYPEMRRVLSSLGHQTTISYLAEMCRRVLDETGLLPHANAGLLAAGDLRILREHCSSAGLMLESASTRLMLPGQAHADAIDKHPRLRLRTIEEAGRLRIPFTTGILIGIGETLEERVDSLMEIRRMNARYGHIQEVIVQNFRAKPGIPMADTPEPSTEDLARTLAVARLILGEMNIQAPPNLTEDYPTLIQAGINDWGGVSPLTRDFINPEKPWPHLDELKERTEKAGFRLEERLSVYPEFIRKERFLSERVMKAVLKAADSRGLARPADSF